MGKLHIKRSFWEKCTIRPILVTICYTNFWSSLILFEGHTLCTQLDQWPFAMPKASCQIMLETALSFHRGNSTWVAPVGPRPLFLQSPKLTAAIGRCNIRYKLARICKKNTSRASFIWAPERKHSTGSVQLLYSEVVARGRRASEKENGKLTTKNKKLMVVEEADVDLFHFC